MIYMREMYLNILKLYNTTIYYNIQIKQNENINIIKYKIYKIYKILP